MTVDTQLGADPPIQTDHRRVGHFPSWNSPALNPALLPHQPNGELDASRASGTGRDEKQRIDLVSGRVELCGSEEIQELRVIERVLSFEQQVHANALVDRYAPVQGH